MIKNVDKLPLLLLALSLFFVFSCDQPYSIQEVNTAKPFEIIDAGNGSEVCFYSEDEEDFTLTIKSKSEETIKTLLALSPVEIYEKYKNEKAPEKLVDLVEKTGFKPDPLNPDVTSGPGGESKATAEFIYNLYKDYFGSKAVLESYVYYHTQPHSYTKDIKNPRYLTAIVNVVEGTVEYTMFRRVIRAFKPNYWGFLTQPETVSKGEILIMKATMSKKRGVKSEVERVNGKFHHLAGYRDY
ncbi:MAG: hypothetical protein JXJ04_23485 [Spirochaetales bacterium]|nr:hypothetical protein [Spirochaetales bacterium]